MNAYKIRRQDAAIIEEHASAARMYATHTAPDPRGTYSAWAYWAARKAAHWANARAAKRFHLERCGVNCPF